MIITDAEIRDAIAAAHQVLRSSAPPPVLLSSQRVSVVDLDIPFGSLLKIMFKWMAAALVVFCCFLPVIFVLWLIVAAIFAALFSGAMSTFHHP